jgi:hypothetical protein
LFGKAPDEFKSLYFEAGTAATTALGPDHRTRPAGIESQLGLLLMVMDAIPPLPREQVASVLDWAESQGLLPTDRMIGVPIFETDKTEREEPKKVYIKLTGSDQTTFTNLAEKLSWSENECVNQLLVAQKTDPQGADKKVRYEARRAIIKSLLGGCLTLRGLADEAEFRSLKKEIAPSHAAFLKDVLEKAVKLESRILDLLPVLAGS